MSEVIVTFEIMPTDVEVDLEKLENDIKDSVNPQRIEKIPIAFGLIALKVTMLIDDAEGTLEKTENKLRNVENVRDVKVIEMTRSL